MTAPPVKAAALKLGLPVFQPASLKPAEEQARLAALKPDVIVVAAYGQILRPSILALPPHECLNIHPSLLPRYRGVSPVFAAIQNGDEFTGVSIMVLDAGVDTGPVLAQAGVRVQNWDTTGSLTEKLAGIGGQLLADVLPGWVDGRMKPVAQDEKLAGYTRQVEKRDGEMNWTRPAPEIWRQVRACQPWPGAYTRLAGKQLKIIEAAPVESEATRPGRVVAWEGGFGIETGRGVLVAMKVQIEGKRPVSGAEFLRGQRQLIGKVLPD